jgi:hypothetical protein
MQYFHQQVCSVYSLTSKQPLIVSGEALGIEGWKTEAADRNPWRGTIEIVRTQVCFSAGTDAKEPMQTGCSWLQEGMSCYSC